MQNDERERVQRRGDDQWARRIRALEREFERADRARTPKAERHSIPLALLSGLVVLLTAVLILQTTKGGGPQNPVAQPAPLGPFGMTPAARWHDAAAAIAVPAATKAGSFPATAVDAALKRARAYVIAAHTNPAVLTAHDTSALTELADPRTLDGVPIAQRDRALASIHLAPQNSLAAAVRADGVLTYRHVARSAHTSEQLVVSVNAIWAYALHAGYPPAAGPGEVVAIHERAQLVFVLAAGVAPSTVRPRPVKDDLLWFDADCSYRSDGVLALPRADDPEALPGYSNGVSVEQAFSLSTAVEVSGHICRR